MVCLSSFVLFLLDGPAIFSLNDLGVPLIYLASESICHVFCSSVFLFACLSVCFVALPVWLVLWRHTILLALLIKTAHTTLITAHKYYLALRYFTQTITTSMNSTSMLIL